MNPQEWIFLQTALLYVFRPIIMATMGIILLGSILASITNLILDVVGHLYRE